jgi:hypothetical protein
MEGGADVKTGMAAGAGMFGGKDVDTRKLALG